MVPCVQVQRGMCWDLRSEIQTKKVMKNVEEDLPRGRTQRVQLGHQQDQETLWKVRLRTELDGAREKPDWTQRQQLGASALSS